MAHSYATMLPTKLTSPAARQMSEDSNRGGRVCRDTPLASSSSEVVHRVPLVVACARQTSSCFWTTEALPCSTHASDLFTRVRGPGGDSAAALAVRMRPQKGVVGGARKQAGECPIFLCAVQ